MKALLDTNVVLDFALTPTAICRRRDRALGRERANVVVRVAHSLQWSDYEDAIQHASATASGIEAIVTRNLNHYKDATLPIYSPADFLAQLPT
jgi:hypothetical protein